MRVLRLFRVDYSDESLRGDPERASTVKVFVGETDPIVFMKLQGFMQTEMGSPRLYQGGLALYPQFRLEVSDAE
jgi:hypothetical protein